jgi:hypothetical protein
MGYIFNDTRNAVLGSSTNVKLAEQMMVELAPLEQRGQRMVDTL